MSEINGIGPNQISGVDSTQLDTTEKVGNNSADTSLQHDTIVVSEEAQQLQSIEQQIHSLSEVDMQRVEEIQTKIAAGSYQVDTQSLAGDMLTLEEAFQSIK